MNQTDELIKILKNALHEDIGEGDHTTLASIPAHAEGKATLLVKNEGILSGVEVIKTLYNLFDPALKIKVLITDGQKIRKGDIVYAVSGPAASILQTERLALNIMQRMSGIATQTSLYVEKIAGTKAKVIDTRKTTPGIRLLEKMAVVTGGGQNHRMGLFDMILLKDNHIDYAGSIENAIISTHQYLKKNQKHVPIEIEVRNFGELEQVLAIGGINRIMLDNFTIENTRKAVDIIAGRYETESSGGITLDNIGDYARCGVDYISVGALTHQIKSLDMSLKAII